MMEDLRIRFITTEEVQNRAPLVNRCGGLDSFTYHNQRIEWVDGKKLEHNYSQIFLETFGYEEMARDAVLIAINCALLDGVRYQGSPSDGQLSMVGGLRYFLTKENGAKVGDLTAVGG